MKTKKLFRRLYSTLTIGLLTGFLILCSNYTLPDIVIHMLLALGICWITTRQNNPAHFKWYTGIMLGLTFLYVYLPRLFYSLTLVVLPLKRIGWIVLGCYWLCIVISAYLSNTKYYNIFPNQSKGISYVFRGLSWTGQVIVWGYVLLILLSEIGIIK